MSEQRLAFLLWHGQQVTAFIECFAGNFGLRINESHDGESGDGFTTAGLAHQRHCFALAHGEADIIHHIDITMAWELDAQVLNFQQHWGFFWRRLAVIAQSLHTHQVSDTLIQALFLCFMRSDGVSEQLVLFALNVLRGLGLCWPGWCSNHGIGDALRNNVQTQHGQHNHHTWEQCLPPFTAQNARLGSGQNVAPGSNRFLQARTDEGQGGFQDDGVSHQQRCEHQDWCRAVAHDVAGQNPWRTCTGDNHSVDIVLAVFTQHVRADNTGELWDVHKGDGTNNHPNE